MLERKVSRLPGEAGSFCMLPFLKKRMNVSVITDSMLCSLYLGTYAVFSVSWTAVKTSTGRDALGGPLSCPSENIRIKYFVTYKFCGCGFHNLNTDTQGVVPCMRKASSVLAASSSSPRKRCASFAPVHSW